MKISTSPWIHQLDKNRPIKKLQEDISPDIAIVGAGIAGISTAFFILRNTSKNVVVLEKNRLAYGATGHNAGQVVTYFERPFVELVKEFSLQTAVEGQRAIEHAWDILELMYNEASLTIPFSRFMGYAGFSTFEEVLHEFEDNFWKTKGGMVLEQICIADNVDWIKKIPEKYAGLYRLEKHEDILERLQTDNRSYIASHAAQKGCINSALFCQEVVAYLERKYAPVKEAFSRRFGIYEETNIQKIVLRHDYALLDAGNHTVTAGNVILCTNGFENMTILNEHGLDIDLKFHHDVEGKVGYMSGYLETYNKPPMAVSYYVDPASVKSTIADPYFYLTRRLHEHEGKKDYNLICVGGPDISLEDRHEYIPDYDFPEEAQKEIDDFVKSTYETDPNRKIDYQFTWHGLMGYTPNGVRRIGFEPKNQVLMYNLGCNGVGILPSVYGGHRIARLISGEKLPVSMFDPL